MLVPSHKNQSEVKQNLTKGGVLVFFSNAAGSQSASAIAVHMELHVEHRMSETSSIR